MNHHQLIVAKHSMQQSTPQVNMEMVTSSKINTRLSRNYSSVRLFLSGYNWAGCHLSLPVRSNLLQLHKCWGIVSGFCSTEAEDFHLLEMLHKFQFKHAVLWPVFIYFYLHCSQIQFSIGCKFMYFYTKGSLHCGKRKGQSWRAHYLNRNI